MLSITATIVPVFVLILIGFAFKRLGFPGEGFWRPAERMAYYVFLPSLIVRNLATADLTVLPVARAGFTIASIALAMTVIALLVRPIIRIDGPGFTSVLQGTIRLNSFVGVAVADGLYGAPGLVVAAFFIAVMMPIVNIISIGALAAFTKTGKAEYAGVPKQIIQNPIIIACAIGWIWNGLGVPMPDTLDTMLYFLDRATLPVALLCVGAGLIINLGRARAVSIGATTCLKLIVMPFVAIGIAHLMGITGVPFAVIVLFAATPASAAAYVLANELGGDAPLMAGILTIETVVAAVTLPPILAWATT